MGNKIIHKKSIISGNMPPLSSLSAGEIAINAADGYIFFKKNSESNEYLSKFVDQHGHTHLLNESLSSFIPQYGGNTISEVFASVLGGFQNNVSGAASSVVNGENNDIDSDFSFIGTGLNNKITFDGNYSFNAAGQNNLIQHENCFTLGSNLSSHANNFTYVNNISANGKLYGDGSELTGIVSGDLNISNLVKSNSGIWDKSYEYSTIYSINSSSYLNKENADSLYLSLTGGIAVGSFEFGPNSENATLYVSDGKVGINSETPNTELTVNGSISASGIIYTNSDVEILDYTKGIILRSPNNSRWRITVDNSGSLAATAI